MHDTKSFKPRTLIVEYLKPAAGTNTYETNIKNIAVRIESRTKVFINGKNVVNDLDHNCLTNSICNYCEQIFSTSKGLMSVGYARIVSDVYDPDPFEPYYLVVEYESTGDTEGAKFEKVTVTVKTPTEVFVCGTDIFSELKENHDIDTAIMIYCAQRFGCSSHARIVKKSFEKLETERSVTPETFKPCILMVQYRKRSEGVSFPKVGTKKVIVTSPTKIIIDGKNIAKDINNHMPLEQGITAYCSRTFGVPGTGEVMQCHYGINSKSTSKITPDTSPFKPHTMRVKYTRKSSVMCDIDKATENEIFIDFQAPNKVLVNGQLFADPKELVTEQDVIRCIKLTAVSGEVTIIERNSKSVLYEDNFDKDLATKAAGKFILDSQKAFYTIAKQYIYKLATKKNWTIAYNTAPFRDSRGRWIKNTNKYISKLNNELKFVLGQAEVAISSPLVILEILKRSGKRLISTTPTNQICLLLYNKKKILNSKNKYILLTNPTVDSSGTLTIKRNKFTLEAYGENVVFTRKQIENLK